jgi:hypothetical protein
MVSRLENSFDSCRTETPICVYKEGNTVVPNIHDLKYTGPFDAVVKSLANKIYTVQVNTSDTIADLKAKLSKETGIPSASRCGPDRQYRMVTDPLPQTHRALFSR